MLSTVVTWGVKILLTGLFCGLMVKNILKVVGNETGSRNYFENQPNLTFPSIHLCPANKSMIPSELPRIQDLIDVTAQPNMFYNEVGWW